MIFKHFKSLIIDLFFAAYRIHTSETFKIAIDKVGGYELEHRGTIQVKVSARVTFKWNK